MKIGAVPAQLGRNAWRNGRNRQGYGDTEPENGRDEPRYGLTSAGAMVLRHGRRSRKLRSKSTTHSSVIIPLQNIGMPAKSRHATFGFVSGPTTPSPPAARGVSQAAADMGHTRRRHSIWRNAMEHS